MSCIALLCSQELVGCGGEVDEGGLPGDLPPPCELDYSYYRVTRVQLPAALSDAYAEGLTFDSGSVTNRLGWIRACFTCNSLVAPETLSAVFDDVTWILAFGQCDESLHQRVTFVQGERVGPEQYRLQEPLPTPAVGSADAVYEGTGAVPLSLFFELSEQPAEVNWVPTLGLGVEFAKAEDIITGFLGFGVSEAVAAEATWDQIASMLTAFLALDERNPGVCVNASHYRSFDADNDGIIRRVDLDQDSFTAPFFGGDLDLIDDTEDGSVYRPWNDGRFDHLSMGMSFEAEAVEIVP